MMHEQSYGIIPYYIDKNNEIVFLIIQHHAGHRGFPKGHTEKGETPTQTAIRETQEETGIKHIQIQKNKKRKEQYQIQKEGKTIEKHVGYFLGYIDLEKEKVQIQKEEVNDYKISAYTQARKTITFTETKNILTNAYNYLCTYHKLP